MNNHKSPNSDRKYAGKFKSHRCTHFDSIASNILRAGLENLQSFDFGKKLLSKIFTGSRTELFQEVSGKM